MKKNSALSEPNVFFDSLDISSIPEARPKGQHKEYKELTDKERSKKSMLEYYASTQEKQARLNDHRGGPYNVDRTKDGEEATIRSVAPIFDAFETSSFDIITANKGKPRSKRKEPGNKTFEDGKPCSKHREALNNTGQFNFIEEHRVDTRTTSKPEQQSMRPRGKKYHIENNYTFKACNLIKTIALDASTIGKPIAGRDNVSVKSRAYFSKDKGGKAKLLIELDYE